MNGPEKKVVHLSLCLLILGIVVRFLPWGLPAIEKFQVGDRVIVANESLAGNWLDSTETQEKEIQTLSKNGQSGLTDKLTSGKSPKKSRPKVSLPIPINTASLDMLCALKGVGPKLAEKIIAHRDAHGPFKNEKDLQKVPGIGKKKLEGILPGVIFD